MAVYCFAALILTGLFCSAILNTVNCYPNQKEKEEIKRNVEDELRELKDRLVLLEKRSTVELENKESNQQRRGVDVQDNGSVFYGGQCSLCAPSSPGPAGSPGLTGSDGRDGRDGRDWNGCSGSNPNGAGPYNSQEHEEPEKPRESPSTNGSYGGAVFVRWGKSECPSSSDLVYSGTTAGAHFQQKGSGSNYLCMPEEPIYDVPQTGTSGQNRALVYGAEYETDTYSQWGHLDDNNVPCAVCWAASRPSLLMVPARNICPGSEWTTEYSGYLVAEYHGHEGRTEFVCMDKTPEAVPRSSHNANGALFYVAEGRCGSSGSGLPCGPYVDGYELTCAVCAR